MAQHTFVTEEGSLEVNASYVFEGKSREEVFAAYINPELIPKWWIDPETVLTVETMDVKEGGQWRFINTIKGQDYLFRGVYHRVVKNEQIVDTWAFDPMPAVMLCTIKFEDADGGTKVSEQFVFQSLEDKKALMESGLTESATRAMMERLEQLL